MNHFTFNRFGNHPANRLAGLEPLTDFGRAHSGKLALGESDTQTGKLGLGEGEILAHENKKVGALGKLGSAVPSVEIGQLVAPQDEKELAAWKALIKQLQRICGVNGAGAGGVDIQNAELGAALGRALRPLDALLHGGQGSGLLPVLPGGKKIRALQLSFCHRTHGHLYVTHVYRIEAPAQKTQPHGKDIS